MGLVNHVCPDDDVVEQALACAHRIAALPRRAVEDTKRILNLHLERAVVATLDFALAAEDRSFTSPSSGPISTGPARPEDARPVDGHRCSQAGLRCLSHRRDRVFTP